MFFKLFQRGFAHILHEAKGLQRLDQVLTVDHKISVLERQGEVGDVVMNLRLLIQMMMSLEHLRVLLHLCHKLVHHLFLVLCVLCFGFALVIVLLLLLLWVTDVGLLLDLWALLRFLRHLWRTTAEHVLVAVGFLQHLC